MDAAYPEGNPLMTIEEKLERIEEMLRVLVERQPVKEFYEIEEFAKLVHKAPFTVRQWARCQRILCVRSFDLGGPVSDSVNSPEEPVKDNENELDTLTVSEANDRDNQDVER